MNKTKLLETLELIRKNRLCCYVQEWCDCKRGNLDKSIHWKRGSEQTGCCEMRDCIEFIRNNMVEDSAGLHICPICKFPIGSANMARKYNGDPRRDSRGRCWCKECTDKFDELEPK